MYTNTLEKQGVPINRVYELLEILRYNNFYTQIMWGKVIADQLGENIVPPESQFEIGYFKRNMSAKC